MQPLQQTIKKVIKELEGRQASGEYRQIMGALEQALGRKHTRHIKLHPFKKGTLRITTDSSAQLYYLNLKKKAILEKLQRLPINSKPKIQKVYFSLGDR